MVVVALIFASLPYLSRQRPPETGPPSLELIVLEGTLIREDYPSSTVWSIEASSGERYVLTGEKTNEVVDLGEGVRVKVEGYEDEVIVSVPEGGEIHQHRRRAVRVINYKVILSEKEISEIINETLYERCDRNGARFYIRDLNKDGLEEITVVTLGLGTFPGEEMKCYTPEGVEVPCPEYLSKWGCIAVISLGRKGNYSKIGELKTKSIFLHSVIVPEANFEDLDSDGIEEILLSGMGVAHDFQLCLLDMDFNAQELEWLKLKEKDGNISEACLWYGSAAVANYEWYIRDINGNGKKELVNRKRWWTSTKPEGLQIAKIRQLNDDWEVCTIAVYEWDGSLFSYNEGLSQEILESSC